VWNYLDFIEMSSVVHANQLHETNYYSTNEWVEWVSWVSYGRRSVDPKSKDMGRSLEQVLNFNNFGPFFMSNFIVTFKNMHIYIYIYIYMYSMNVCMFGMNEWMNEHFFWRGNIIYYRRSEPAPTHVPWRMNEW
jgi:hypothetical protein